MALLRAATWCRRYGPARVEPLPTRDPHAFRPRHRLPRPRWHRPPPTSLATATSSSAAASDRPTSCQGQDQPTGSWTTSPALCTEPARLAGRGTVTSGGRDPETTLRSPTAQVRGGDGPKAGPRPLPPFASTIAVTVGCPPRKVTAMASEPTSHRPQPDTRHPRRGSRPLKPAQIVRNPGQQGPSELPWRAALSGR